MREKLTIEKLDSDGIGRATWTREDGFQRQVEVPYTLTGEVIEAELKRSGKRQFYAIPETIIEPSKNRMTPRCLHFGTCGGCSFQHMVYSEQLAWKEGKIRALFPGQEIHAIIASPKEYHYRNKLEMSFSETSKGDKYLGLILSRTRGYVFNLTECHLGAPWCEKMVQAVREWWLESDLKAYWHANNTGSLRTLGLRYGSTSEDKMVILTVSGNPDFALKQHHLDSLLRVVNSVAEATVVLRIHQVLKGQPTQFYEMILQGKDYIREEICGLEFRISPSAFFQPNSYTAELLYSRAIELANIGKDSVVYDLYCGAGVFGMCAARVAKEVVGIELNRDAAYDAKCNSDRLELTNFKILTGDVGTVLREKAAELPKPDVLIVDPPRVGLDKKACEEIIKLNAETLVYVSCKPETQAKNVEELVSAGYRVEHVQPVDQFPQTPHVENIVVLKRK